MSNQYSRQVFDVQVDTWVKRAVGDGADSYSRLLSMLPGVYPTQVLESLERLRRRRKVSTSMVTQIIAQARIKARPVWFQRDALLPPHPLDFEWRFSRTAGTDLLARASELAGVDGKILLLGTPTLAILAANNERRNEYIYVGEDNAISRQVLETGLKALSTLEVRLCGPDAIRPNEATVVIMDPPWYVDFLRPMMRAAAFACRSGGHVLVSLPPIGTNSHVAVDRARFLSMSAALSLNPRHLDPATILYDTPYFEANALAAEGYPNTPKAWRSGDLFVLEKAEGSPASELVRASRRRQWHEIVINRMRLFVKKSVVRDGQIDGELTSIVPGDILPSVKRTDERRKLAQVWTSGNRIFGTVRPDIVRIAAEMAAGGGIWGGQSRLSAEERDAATRLSYKLGDLAILEYSEERTGRLEEPECITNRPKSKLATSSRTSRHTRSGMNT